MKKEINLKTKTSKIIVSILLGLVILYSLKSFALSLVGKETVGYITSVSQRNDRDSNSSKNRYRNTANYYFELDGKKYESHITYKTNMPIVRKEDQKIESVTIQYLEFLPIISTIAKYNEATVINYIFWIGLIIGCIFLILVICGVKFKKSKELKIEQN